MNPAHQVLIRLWDPLEPSLRAQQVTQKERLLWARLGSRLRERVRRQLRESMRSRA